MDAHEYFSYTHEDAPMKVNLTVLYMRTRVGGVTLTVLSYPTSYPPPDRKLARPMGHDCPVEDSLTFLVTEHATIQDSLVAT